MLSDFMIYVPILQMNGDAEKVTTNGDTKKDDDANENETEDAKDKEENKEDANETIEDAEKSTTSEKKKTSTLKAEAEIMKTGIVTYEEKIAEFQMKEAKEKTSTNISLFIERKLKEVESSLKESILSEVNKSSKILDEKMNAVMESANSYADVLNRNAPTVPSASQFPFTPSSELRSVIREERNEQLTEIAEQKQRASNFVVHGVPESAGQG